MSVGVCVIHLLKQRFRSDPQPRFLKAFALRAHSGRFSVETFPAGKFVLSAKHGGCIPDPHQDLITTLDNRNADTDCFVIHCRAGTGCGLSDQENLPA